MEKISTFRTNPKDAKYAYKKKRWFALSLLVSIVVLSILSLGCGPGTDVSCSTDADADAFLETLHVTDPQFRFAYPGRPELLASNSFWFSGGDVSAANAPANPVPMPIVYGVNGVSIDLRERDAPDSCTFSGQNGCYSCNLCVNGLGVCNNNTSVGIEDAGQSLISLAEIDKDTSEEKSVGDFSDPGDVCFLRPDTPGFGSTPPKKNALLTLKKIHPCGNTEEIAHFETNVVNTQRNYDVDLEVYNDTADPTVQRFIYKMGLNDGKLMENFSPDLRVTRVIILAEAFDTANMMTTFDPTPAGFRAVRPSRILFLPSFQPGNVNDNIDEGTNRCYVDPGADDGGFDLFRNCRKNPNSTELQAHEATPTYMNADGLRNLTLTWIIEYKLADGLPDPPDFTKGRPKLRFILEEVL